MSDKTPPAPWTKSLPTHTGRYWHWDGDEDSAPLPLSIMCGATDGVIVMAGQYGRTHAIPVADYGGWWQPCPAPSTTMSHDAAPHRIDYDENGVDDLWIPSHDFRLERMGDGHYWLKIGPHVVHFTTRRNALISTRYENQGEA